MTMMLCTPTRLTGDVKGHYIKYSTESVSPLHSPTIQCSNGKWCPTPEWNKWAETTRESLIGEIMSHPNWFTKPPKRDTIETLFSPWCGKNMKSELQIFCKTPETALSVSGSAPWSLRGLFLTATVIYPDWNLCELTDEIDTISLFGDSDGGASISDDEKEIHIAVIQSANQSDNVLPTRIRNRVWDENRFMAKERVREMRLKAQIADRIVAKEESRFIRIYGNLNDTESQFSDYDLTDNEDQSVEGE